MKSKLLHQSCRNGTKIFLKLNIKSVRKHWQRLSSLVQILDLVEKLGIVEASPRKTSIQRNRSNIPSCSPIDHYKKFVAIRLLDSLIIIMQDRFSDEDRHAHHLLYIVPSIIINNTLELSEMLFWENDLPFPKSLGNELRNVPCLESTSKVLKCRRISILSPS